MSRGLLQGVIVDEVPPAENPNGTPKDGNSQQTETAATEESKEEAPESLVRIFTFTNFFSSRIAIRTR